MNIQKEDDIHYYFNQFVGQVESPKLKAVCNALLGYKEFWYGVGSLEHHHSFERGLIIHTLEVTANAIHTGKLYEECDDDILITAALWHDLGKIWDYQKNDEGRWFKTDYHGKVHHISGSNAEFTAVALNNEVDRITIQKIQHCIISHHGTKDWGSPRRPESLEAIILHQSDMISAMYPKHVKPISTAI